MAGATPTERADRSQTIRVFVSSTFRDMHAERDVLNRLVFPEVRRRCQSRGAEFVGIDMRWGVTEDEVQRDGALAICLREIDQCRPFFVCFLGDRYGSVYPPDEVPAALGHTARGEPALRPIVDAWYRLDEAADPPVYRMRRERGHPIPETDAQALVRFWEAHGVVGAGDSLTAHEVLRGVFESNAPPAHALFYLRTSDLVRDPAFPPPLMPQFVETDETRRHKLEALKARIRGAQDRVVVHDYSARYAGLTIDAAFLPTDLSSKDRTALDDGVVTPEEWPDVSPHLREALEQHGTVALTGMETFAARVTDDLWRVIEPQLARPVVLDAHQRERTHHERFVSHHTDYFQGRGPERERVRSYLATLDDREILVVTGEPGVGKSAFLAACVRDARARHPGTLVIPHFIGAAPDSASLPATLRSLCEALRREVPLDEAVADDPDKLRVQLRAFLEPAGARRPIILVIDALNQLDPSGRSHDLDWLPLWAPPGTRIVVSALPGDCLEQLTRRVPADHIITIPLLPEDERRALITAVLARRRKRLTPDQLTALLDTRTRPDAALPLYTLVALEELFLFGQYGALNARLASLPPTLPELFAQALVRLEHDYTRPAVEAVCALLAVARAGLLEAEVLDLLSIDVPFPRLRWTRLYRALEPYFKPLEEDAADTATGRLDFYHDQLRLAVFHRYLQMVAPDATPTEAYRTAHRQLAAYFRSIAYDDTLPTRWRPDRVRSLSELPFHQTHTERWEEVETTLCDLDFVAAKCVSGMTFGLVTDYDVALARLPDEREGSGAERETSQAVAYYTRRLVDYASHWSQFRANRSSDSTDCDTDTRRFGAPNPPDSVRIWSEHEIQADCDRVLSAPTRVDRIRAFGQFVSSERHNFVRFAHSRAFVIQQAINSASSGPVLLAAEPLLDSAGHSTSTIFIRPARERHAWNPRPAVLQTLVLPADILAFAITANGRRAVSGNGDWTLGVWDLQSGEYLRSFSGHTQVVHSVAVSADGQSALSGSLDGTLRIWDLASGRCLRTLDHREEVRTVAMTPDGGCAVSNGGGTLRVWDLRNGRCLQELPGPRWTGGAIALDADGRRAISGAPDLKLRERLTNHILRCAP